jgi:hypothetical protein
MKNFINFIKQKYEVPQVELWDVCVLEELAEYSAYISNDDGFTITKLYFEDEQLATLFFLKFSES